MPRRRSDTMDRDEAVTLPDDPLQANRDLCVWLKPTGYGPRYAFVTAISLANVVRQDRVLIGDLWIEERHVRCLVRVPRLPEGAKVAHVRVRHRLVRQSRDPARLNLVEKHLASYDQVAPQPEDGPQVL